MIIKKQKPVFLTMFMNFSNVMLVKDVGMIPYEMQKTGAYDAYIAGYTNNKEFPYLDKELQGLRLDSVKAVTGKPSIDGVIYLWENAKKIDVLQLYHIQTTWNVFFVYTYLLRNRKGRVYLKLDYDSELCSIKLNCRQKWLVKKCALISTEFKSIADRLTTLWGRKVIYIPNGMYGVPEKMVSYEQKENIICTVGRIGTQQKATEIVLDIFRKFVKTNSGWKLRIIGPIESGFEEYIQDYFEQFPDLRECITFTGVITSRAQMMDEYKKAKIFLSTSRREGFSIAFIEALMSGVFFVSTDLDCIYDIIDQDRYGYIFPIDDVQKGVQALEKACQREEQLSKEVCYAQQKYAREHFDWDMIGRKLLHELS